MIYYPEFRRFCYSEYYTYPGIPDNDTPIFTKTVVSIHCWSIVVNLDLWLSKTHRIDLTCLEPGLLAWASADFFPGEGKNFPGGQGPTFCLKSNKKDTIFPKNSKTYYFLAGLGQPGGARAPLALPCGRPWLLVNFLFCCSTWVSLIGNLSVSG